MRVWITNGLVLSALLISQATSVSPLRESNRVGESQGISAASLQSASKETAPALLTAAQLESLLPATVYFRGKSATVQLRNAGGARFGPDGYVLAAMVDTSGYASSVQERYQFYLITEIAISIGGKHLDPGAYGAGLVDGKLIVMDIGGHTLFSADAVVDQAMTRPRPLQLTAAPNGEVKLYLGRQAITIKMESRP